MSHDFSPFRTPAQSIRGFPPESNLSSRRGSSTQGVKQRRLKSARLIGVYEKPWTENSPYKGRERWDKVILWTCITTGFLLGVLLCYFAYAAVPRHEYCLVMDDQFENMDNWEHEIQLGGFGTGSFDWTTDDPLNTYVDEEGLHIVPTLTLETTSYTGSQLLNGTTVNLTSMGVCTSGNVPDCVVTSNLTTGTIINPVRSARITTKGKKTIKYGRVEVVAKMPAGSWLWPAIWMMPEDSVYGIWPKSGEIDIAELRGNDPATYAGGRDTASSALHWGVDLSSDRFLQTTNSHTIKRSDYSKGFHTYGLEWSETYLYTYIDNRLSQVLSVGFGKYDMWTRSGLEKLFPGQNPWSGTGRYNTPFDQDFYLILNVAVGGTGGYFGDSVDHKPWVNLGWGTAARDFWEANSTWIDTWAPGAGRGMTVKSARMWQQGACGDPS